jgi:hypothetical protein
MSKIQNSDLCPFLSNEEHKTSQSNKRNKLKSQRFKNSFPTQPYLQTLYQALSSTLILLLMHLQGWKA